MLDELNGPDFRHAIEEKFGIDLLSRPTMFTVRGECRASDGKIHTDSATKLITVLLYMNEKWDKDGGRLRILRNGADLDDYAEEVPPHGGTLLVFRRSEKSWHGHQPFHGPRRAIQMNWVTDKSVVAREAGPASHLLHDQEAQSLPQGELGANRHGQASREGADPRLRPGRLHGRDLRGARAARARADRRRCRPAASSPSRPTSKTIRASPT